MTVRLTRLTMIAFVWHGTFSRTRKHSSRWSVSWLPQLYTTDEHWTGSWLQRILLDLDLDPDCKLF